MLARARGMDPSRLERWLPHLDFKAERIDDIRYDILAFEAKCTQEYFNQYFERFPKFLRIKKRYRRGAKEPLNNLLNLGYEVLWRRVHVAVIGAHLDPYLGYLHSTRQYQPSLVYDMIEPWRAIVEDFILKNHEKFGNDSFFKHGKRSFLKKDDQFRFTKALDKLIDNKRIPYNYRDNSKTTRLRTAIKEEPRKLAQYIRGNSDL